MSHQKLQELQMNIRRHIIGKDDVIDHLITALLAGGHVLLEDVPALVFVQITDDPVLDLGDAQAVFLPFRLYPGFDQILNQPQFKSDMILFVRFSHLFFS